jgi:hypothetical protein
MELTKLQLKAILWDIKAQGVYLPSLQEDLFDHICCLVEEEMINGAEFRVAFLKVRNRMGPLVKLQYQTDEELISHKLLERIVKVSNYFAVGLYLILGIGMFFGPLLLAILELSVLYGVIAIPFVIMGYAIMFKRIDYRKFDIIPYKESFSPVQMTF